MQRFKLYQLTIKTVYAFKVKRAKRVLETNKLCIRKISE